MSCVLRMRRTDACLMPAHHVRLCDAFWCLFPASTTFRSKTGKV